MSTNKKYPFKFLDAYQREDSQWFFGRDEEIESLYEMVFQSTVVLVYGASGTGKTSLINCGLAGKFQPHDWFPIMVRRGNNLNDSLNKELLASGGSFEAQSFDFDWEDELSESPNETASELSPTGNALRSIYQTTFKPIYLIFDQFEELFVLGSKKEQLEFFKTTLEILNTNQPVKIIFSIREEYLGYLYEFEKVVPQLLKKKLRVEPMNLDKVKQVILGAATSEDSNITIKPGDEDAVTEGVFEKIKGRMKSLTIQLPFLQVFLDKYYLSITNDESRTKPAEFSADTLAEMGEIGDILIELLEEQVTSVSRQLKGEFHKIKPGLIWKILSPFSTLEGTKEPISKKELQKRLPKIDSELIDAVVEAFISSRILRYIESSDLYEIAHDALAKPIAERRSAEETTLLEIKRLVKSQVSINEEAREYFSEKQLAFIDTFLKKLVLTEEEHSWIQKSRNHFKELREKEIQEEVQLRNAKKRKRRKWVILSIFILISGFFASSYFALKFERQYDEIKKNRDTILKTQEQLVASQTWSNKVLRLMMEGRDTIYEQQNDSILKEVLEQEIELDIDSVITPKAYITTSNRGSNYRNIVFWIDVPPHRKKEIKYVAYHFCKGFTDKRRVSHEASSSFAIGYLGYGICPELILEIELKENRSIYLTFSLEDYFQERNDILKINESLIFK